MNDLDQFQVVERLTGTELLREGEAVAIEKGCQQNAKAGSVELPQIKNILLLTTPTRVSATALKYASFFATKLGSKIAIEYAIEPNDPAISGAGLREEITGRDGLKPEHLSSILIRSEAVTCQQIIDDATLGESDLIIMSANFPVNSGHFLHGHPIENLVQHAPCPVFLVSEAVRLEHSHPAQTKSDGPPPSGQATGGSR